MNDGELQKEFIRIERTGDRVRILVREIHWDGPAKAVSTWTVAQYLPATASDAEAEAVTPRILEDDQYFRICGECSERTPRGWMHDEELCQGCAVANHGVVY
jgi:hypothetical protein